MRHLGFAWLEDSCRTCPETFEKEHTMSAVTYGVARAPRGAVSQSIKAERPRPIFARFLEALKESRRQQAHQLIADYAQLLPNDPESPV